MHQRHWHELLHLMRMFCTHHLLSYSCTPTIILTSYWSHTTPFISMIGYDLCWKTIDLLSSFSFYMSILWLLQMSTQPYLSSLSLTISTPLAPFNPLPSLPNPTCLLQLPIPLTLQPKLELHLLCQPNLICYSKCKPSYSILYHPHNPSKSLSIWPMLNFSSHKPSNKPINTLSGKQPWKLSLMFCLKTKHGSWCHIIPTKISLLVIGCLGISKKHTGPWTNTKLILLPRASLNGYWFSLYI